MPVVHKFLQFRLFLYFHLIVILPKLICTFCPCAASRQLWTQLPTLSASVQQVDTSMHYVTGNPQSCKRSTVKVLTVLSMPSLRSVTHTKLTSVGTLPRGDISRRTARCRMAGWSWINTGTRTWPSGSAADSRSSCVNEHRA